MSCTAVLLSDLCGRDVALLGAGREALAVRRLLRERCPGKTFTIYAETAPDADLAKRLQAEGDELVVGAFVAGRLCGHEVLLRSPGVSPYRPELQAARAAGVAFTTASTLWFAEHPGARTIAVTGTKGKSTTTALTAHLLNAAGLRAVACGNIGQPMLDVDPSGVDWWVIELSSYQLCDLEAAPDLACITNLSPEHLDWHAGWDHYRADKLRLASLVKPGGLFANHADAGLREALAEVEGVQWFNHLDGWHVDEGKLRFAHEEQYGLTLPAAPGAHNLSNLAAAISLAGAAQSLPDPLQQALDAFTGLPHRLRLLGERDGIRYVDDSLSTTPVATLAALEALAGAPVTLLVGGLDRGLDWRARAAAFCDLSPRAIIALPDNGPHILAQLAAGGLAPAAGMHQATDLAAAMELARSITPRGGVVLLSPGAPSFPHFADYRARGRAFALCAGMPIAPE